MHDKATAANADGDYEQAVLRHVLDWQPTILRLEDLIREVSPDPREFAHRDAVARAVRDLAKVGLLHQQGECVLPTPATVYVRGWELG
ncbi:MAG TPA: hypothetical protein VIT89_08925 [Solirubrobacterales bacterium]